MNKFEATPTFSGRSAEAVRRENAQEMRALAKSAMANDRVRAKSAELASRARKRESAGVLRSGDMR